MARIKSKRVKDGRKKLAKITRMFKGASKVKVGFPQGTDSDELDKAVWNEFGTEGGGFTGAGIPERPFMRNGLRDGVPEIKRVLKVVGRKMILGQITPRKSLGLLGETGIRLIKKSAIDLKDPANSEVTIMLKGSSNPLVDEGSMIASITMEIVE